MLTKTQKRSLGCGLSSETVGLTSDINCEPAPSVVLLLLDDVFVALECK